MALFVTTTFPCFHVNASVICQSGVRPFLFSLWLNLQISSLKADFLIKANKSNGPGGIKQPLLSHSLKSSYYDALVGCSEGVSGGGEKTQAAKGRSEKIISNSAPLGLLLITYSTLTMEFLNVEQIIPKDFFPSLNTSGALRNSADEPAFIQASWLVPPWSALDRTIRRWQTQGFLNCSALCCRCFVLFKGMKRGKRESWFILKMIFPLKD